MCHSFSIEEHADIIFVCEFSVRKIIAADKEYQHRYSNRPVRSALSSPFRRLKKTGYLPPKVMHPWSKRRTETMYVDDGALTVF